jgi:redox-sensitive bicupin YhaK (pirin superfamily)
MAGKLRLFASPDGAEGSLSIHQDARLYLATLEPAGAIHHALPTGRHAWLQVLSGKVDLHGEQLSAGDGAAISDESELRIVAQSAAEVMLFDLA